MESEKNDTNELTYKTEVGSQTQKTNLGYQSGEVKGMNKESEVNTHTPVYKVDNQQGPTA